MAVYDMSNRKCVKTKILRTLADGKTVYPEKWRPVEEVKNPSGEVWECYASLVTVEDNNGIHKEIEYRPLHKVETEAAPMRTNAATGESKNNAVALDPVRLRYAFPNGVPNVTLRDLLWEPEKHAAEWESIQYIFTGSRTYRNEHEKRIADLLNKICE